MPGRYEATKSRLYRMCMKQGTYRCYHHDLDGRAVVGWSRDRDKYFLILALARQEIWTR